MSAPKFQLTTKDLLNLCAKDLPHEGVAALRYFSTLYKTFGPVVPFLLRRDCLDKVPYDQVGWGKVDPATCTQRAGEMWVLFVYHDVFRTHCAATTPLRTDGFVLVLEWRKDEPDSPLLSSAFHKLAEFVRGQQKVSGWGLHPAHARYNDTVDFSDEMLFSDAANVENISSAYGALSAGLYCAVRNTYPDQWSFPTLRWDPYCARIAGVAGFSEKLQVAQDCGAKVVSVAREQMPRATEDATRIPGASRVPRIWGVRVVRDAVKQAEVIAFGLERRQRWMKCLVTMALLPLTLLLLLAAGVYWDATREVRRYYASSGMLFGVDCGREPIKAAQLKRDGGYVYAYRGYRRTPEGFVRRLVQVTHVNALGQPVPFPCPTKLEEAESYHAARGISRHDYNYDAQGRLLTLHEVDGTGRTRGSLMFTPEVSNRVEHVAFDLWGVREQPENAREYWMFDDRGRLAHTLMYNTAGWTCEQFFDATGKLLRAEMRNPDGELAPDYGGVAIYAFDYCTNGLERGRFFYAADRTSRVLFRTMGISGYTNVYDAVGNVTRRVHLGVRGEIACNMNGVAVIDQEYDEQRRVTQCLFRDANLQPVVQHGHDPSTAVGYSHTFDTSGVECVERYFDAANRPAIDRGIAYVIVSNAERRMSRRFFGTNDCLVMTRDSCAGVDDERDEHGNIVRETTIGLDGKPCTNGYGMATVQRRFDNYGRETYIAWQDAEGRPVPLRTQNCEAYGDFKSLDIVYSNAIQRICQTYTALDETGEVAQCKLRLYPSGDLDKVQYFNKKGALVPGPNGWAQVCVQYDSRGFAVVKEFLTADGQLHGEKGTDISRQTCQVVARPDGMDVSLHMLGADGYHREGGFGVASIFLSYDTFENLTALSMRDKNNKPVCFTGTTAVICHFAYAGKDKLSSVWFLKEDGSPFVLNTVNGKEIVRFEIKYDVFGKICVLSGLSETGEAVQELPYSGDAVQQYELINRMVTNLRHVFRFRNNYFDLGNVEELELLQPPMKK